MQVSEMLSDLGDHGFTDSSTATKVRALQKAIWEIEGLRPWPFLEAQIDLTFNGSSPVATNLPTVRAALKLKDTSSGLILEPTTAEEIEDYVGTQLALVGAPRAYYAEGESLKVWPVPPNGTTVRMRYLKVSPAITSSSAEADILLPARHHEVIVLGALVRLYAMEDDPELASSFEGHYEKALQEMVEDLFRKQYDRSDFVRVNDPDSWSY